MSIVTPGTCKLCWIKLYISLAMHPIFLGVLYLTSYLPLHQFILSENGYSDGPSVLGAKATTMVHQ
jgi:hypothetical protein